MAVLSPIIALTADFPALLITEFLHGCRVALQPVSDDDLCPTVALQRLAHDPQRRGFVSGFGSVALQNLALVIHSAPEVVYLAIDLDIDLVQCASALSEAPHPIDPLTTDIGGKQGAEPDPPEQHSLLTDVDVPRAWPSYEAFRGTAPDACRAHYASLPKKPSDRPILLFFVDCNDSVTIRRTEKEIYDESDSLWWDGRHVCCLCGGRAGSLG